MPGREGERKARQIAEISLPLVLSILPLVDYDW
jgi:hypothetical protein